MSAVFDFKTIGRVYRDALGGPPFPIEQVPEGPKRWFCDFPGCTYWIDENREGRGTCGGHCGEW